MVLLHNNNAKWNTQLPNFNRRSERTSQSKDSIWMNWQTSIYDLFISTLLFTRCNRTEAVTSHVYITSMNHVDLMHWIKFIDPMFWLCESVHCVRRTLSVALWSKLLNCISSCLRTEESRRFMTLKLVINKWKAFTD